MKKRHLPRGHGTTAPGERYYRGLLRYYRAEVRYYRRCLRYYRSTRSNTTASPPTAVRTREKRINGGSSNVQGKGGDKEENVYVMIPPKPFQRGPPLNSTAFLRLKSTKKKRRKDAVFNSLRGAPIRLMPSDETSGKLKAHD